MERSKAAGWRSCRQRRMRGLQMGWEGVDASANDLHLVLFNAKLTPPQLPPRAHFLP